MILTKCRHRITVLVSLVKVAAVWNLEFNFKSLDILMAQAVSNSQNVCKEYPLLSCKYYLVQSSFGLYHGDYVACFMFKLFAKENLPVGNANKI